MRVGVYVVLASFSALVCTGCNNPEPQSPSTASSTIRVGAVLPTFAHPFFIAQKSGLDAEAAALGSVDLDVRDGKDDDRAQIEQVEALLTRGIDVLVLCPRDQEAIGRAVESANREDVPVIALNRRVARGNVATYVGADDADAGRMQARALVDALGERGGRILYLHGTQGSSPQIARAAGFREILKDHPKLTIAEERYCDFQADKTKADMAVLVQRYKPGEIQAIVAQNDEMAIPAAGIAQREGWRDVVVIGCDGTSEAFDAIRNGAMHATVLQDAAEQGRLALRAAVDVVQKREVGPEILTPLPVVTKANVDRLKPSY